MKTKFFSGIFLLTLFLSMTAFAKTKQPAVAQQGTVVNVDREEISSPNQCCYSGTDTPLQSSYYAYKVNLQVGCMTYEGEYDTALDYFPSAFSSGKSLQVRVTKHEMSFDVPGGPGLKMYIIQRRKDPNSACDDSRASR